MTAKLKEKWTLPGAVAPRPAPPAAPGKAAWSAGILLRVLAVLLLTATAACGRKLPPQPNLGVAPQEPRAWQREGTAIVTWPLAAPETERVLGGVKSYLLRIEQVPARCLACAPFRTEELELEPGVGPWRAEGGWAYYTFSLPEQPSLWRFRVATVHERGTTPLSGVALLEAPVEVPAHQLGWEWVPQQEEAEQEKVKQEEVEQEEAKKRRPARRVRLFWKPRRERIVRTVDRAGGMVEKERFFRANLYRRRPGRPWPMKPLNATPLQARQAIVPLPPERRRDRRVWEFTLRLVDQFGNEGALAPPVRVRDRGGRP